MKFYNKNKIRLVIFKLAYAQKWVVVASDEKYFIKCHAKVFYQKYLQKIKTELELRTNKTKNGRFSNSDLHSHYVF